MTNSPKVDGKSVVELGCPATITPLRKEYGLAAAVPVVAVNVEGFNTSPAAADPPLARATLAVVYKPQV